MMASNVTNLFSWQVALEYNSSVIVCTDVWLPEDHVFAGQDILSDDPTLNGGRTSGGLNYSLWAVSLFSGSVTFTQGTLFKMNFTVVGCGETAITIGTRQTPIHIGSPNFPPYFPQTWYSYFQDPDLNDIPLVEMNGYVQASTAALNHEVAITNIGLYRTVVSNRTSTSLSVTAQNQGDLQETFTLILSYNSTAFGSQMITVSNGSSITLSFKWNTTGVSLGNYTVTATATPVLGETDTADNSQASTIQVSILGDINGDGRVDMKDVSKVTAAFQVSPTSPKWASNGDLDENGVIDMKDISTIAKHFGEHYP